MNCRHCKTILKNRIIDLGYAPPSNAYLDAKDLSSPETYYPLRVNVCHKCWLAQTEDYTDASKIFDESYAYFSSTSKSWMEHAKKYSLKMIHDLGLDNQSNVIEIASNDGYLLKNFLDAGIPCLGIEPTESTAQMAESLGVPVIQEFFGEELGNALASSNKHADLIVGNNVYAHVPDINSFTKGLKAVLKSNGTITLEFPHLLKLISGSQFDTIYHEHYSYLSLYTVNNIFSSFGLRVFNVEELETHGGSLRVYGCHDLDDRPTLATVNNVLRDELQFGLNTIEPYLKFQNRVLKIKNELLSFLIDKKMSNKVVVAYGAAAKGNTLLNYSGVKPDLIPFVYDLAPSKQGKYLPGSHIPILSPESILDTMPDYVLILPWNITEEIRNQLGILLPKTKFVTAVPELRYI